MYELYWLSKYFWRCSVEKTFLTSNKSDDLLLSNSSSLDFLASSLSCHKKELRNRDILKIFPTLAAFASLFSWRALYPCRSSKTCILNSFGLTQKDHKYTQGHRHRHHRPVHLLLHVLLLDLSLHYLLLLVRWTTVEDTPDICHRHSGGDGVIIFSLKSKNRKLKLEMSIFHAIL